MPQTQQDYKNHARFFPPFHFFVLPVLLINFLNSARHLYQRPSLSTGFALVVAAALVMLALTARVMALRVQDRVIRLEMRLRLGGCLPPDLRSRVDQLTPEQLVALRFAGDAELPDLIRDVLAGNLPTQKSIKLRVKNWQGDFLRA
jgi:hypothetical protein